MSKRLFYFLCAIVILVLSTVSCAREFQDPVIIWTNRSEIVTYGELFNLTTDKAQVVVVYKENPVEAFPPLENEDIPDIVIGPWLKNAETQNNFMPVDYFFDDQLISKTQFYPQLLQFGNIGSQHYLLPISFNVSTIVFSQTNSNLIPENFMLSTDQIRDIGGSVNELQEDIYTSMGFAPSWNADFLYEVAKLNKVHFSEQRRSTASFSWNEENLNETIDYFKDWTTSKNTSTIAETEYQFKYLYNPTLKNITDNNSLFAFMQSDELFTSSPERLNGIYYRWLHKDNVISVHDDLLTMGIYKHTENLAAAEQFVIWFMNEENQEIILNWYDSLNLYTNMFGLAGGFSSIRSVNERVYPILYPILWGNLPPQDALSAPRRLPSNWDEIKETIILPYLLDSVDTDLQSEQLSIEERLSDWYRFEQ